MRTSQAPKSQSVVTLPVHHTRLLDRKVWQPQGSRAQRAFGTHIARCGNPTCARVRPSWSGLLSPPWGPLVHTSQGVATPLALECDLAIAFHYTSSDTNRLVGIVLALFLEPLPASWSGLLRLPWGPLVLTPQAHLASLVLYVRVLVASQLEPLPASWSGLLRLPGGPATHIARHGNATCARVRPRYCFSLLAAILLLLFLSFFVPPHLVKQIGWWESGLHFSC